METATTNNIKELVVKLNNELVHALENAEYTYDENYKCYNIADVSIYGGSCNIFINANSYLFNRFQLVEKEQRRIQLCNEAQKLRERLNEIDEELDKFTRIAEEAGK